MKQTEAQFQKAVIEAAQLANWRVAHFRTGRTGSGGYATPVQADGAGFPDLVMVRGARILFVELKSKTGRVSAAQKEWLTALFRVEVAAPPNVRAYLWTPDSWDEIQEAIR